jgi:hypothetical protein
MITIENLLSQITQLPSSDRVRLRELMDQREHRQELVKPPVRRPPVIIEELPYDPELARLFEQAIRNLKWFSEHAEKLEVFKKHRGRHVAAAGGELFVADTAEEVERLAREKHPGEMPHVRYIPREKSYRIYACQR